jgi:DNA-directed RNA polymerase subunit H (RpoH/RPB5)
LDEIAQSKYPEKINLPLKIRQGDKDLMAEDAIATNDVDARRISDKVHTSDNGLHYLVIQDRTTFQEISKNHHLHLWEIYRFNDLDRDAKEPEMGQRIYLNRKRSKVKKGQLTHTVIHGETMYEISQQYGIRIRSLYRINRMNKGTQAQTGDVIKLNKKAVVK